MVSSGDSPTRTDPDSRSKDMAGQGLGVGTRLAGRFLLREVLGSGSTGTVYAALDSLVGEKVAIKLLHAELHGERTLERVRREVRASRSGHPNLLAVHDLHQSGGHVFLSMELIEGPSLKQLLEGRDRLEPDEVVAVGRQIAAALAHLHSRGIVHRDIKPGNILFDRDGRAMLCDLGLARVVDEGVTVTRTDAAVGTPAFMAPEQGLGARPGAPADVYGLGLTLYQSLSGSVPLTADSAVATLARRQRQRPTPVRRTCPECPPWLGRLLDRMLEPRPEHRPSAAEVARALKAGSFVSRPRRRTVVSIAAAIFGVAIVSAILLDWAQRRPAVGVTVKSDEIVGRDAGGREVWRRDLEVPVVDSMRADLDADGREEIILVQYARDPTDSRAANEAGPQISVFGTEGTERLRFRPEADLEWSFPYDVELISSVSVIDVDHDDRPEIAILSHHRNYYPAVLHLYWPLQDRVDPVLLHPGHIYHLVPAPPSGPPGLRFVAINNVAGMTGFVGEIAIEPRRLGMPVGGQFSGPLEPVKTTTTRYLWRGYAPLALLPSMRSISRARLANTPSGGIEVWIDDDRVAEFSAGWNPDPDDPLDLRKVELEFFASLQSLAPGGQPSQLDAILDARRVFETRYASLLERAEYRYLLDLSVSAAAARAGGVDEAIGILARARRMLDHGEIVYRLAQLYAVAGDFESASRLARDTALYENLTPRSGFDAPHLLLRLGIQLGDRRMVDEAIDKLDRGAGRGAKTGVTAASLARARLWWDETYLEDEDVGSWAYAPAGEAIGCLARWRRGSSRRSDAAAMIEAAARNPDAEAEFRLAGAAALLADNAARQALDRLNDLVFDLTVTAREDFGARQTFELAQALRVLALERLAERDRAAAEATALLDELDPALLPGALVREVLAGIEAGTE